MGFILPTFAIEKATIHVGKYAFYPMDPMGMTVMTVKDIVNTKYAVFFVVSKVHSLTLQGDKLLESYLLFVDFLRVIVEDSPSTGQHVLF